MTQLTMFPSTYRPADRPDVQYRGIDKIYAIKGTEMALTIKVFSVTKELLNKTPFSEKKNLPCENIPKYVQETPPAKILEKLAKTHFSRSCLPRELSTPSQYSMRDRQKIEKREGCVKRIKEKLEKLIDQQRHRLQPEVERVAESGAALSIQIKSSLGQNALDKAKILAQRERKFTDAVGVCREALYLCEKDGDREGRAVITLHLALYQIENIKRSCCSLRGEEKPVLKLLETLQKKILVERFRFPLLSICLDLNTLLAYGAQNKDHWVEPQTLAEDIRHVVDLIIAVPPSCFDESRKAEEKELREYKAILEKASDNYLLYERLAELTENNNEKKHILYKGMLHATSQGESKSVRHFIQLLKPLEKRSWIDEKLLFEALCREGGDAKQFLSESIAWYDEKGYSRESIAACEFLFEISSNRKEQLDAARGIVKAYKNLLQSSEEDGMLEAPTGNQRPENSAKEKYGEEKTSVEDKFLKSQLSWYERLIPLLINEQYWDEAKESAESALQIAEEEKKELIYNQLETIYLALDFEDDTDIQNRLENVWRALGEVYCKQEQFELAEKTYRTACEKLGSYANSMRLGEFLKARNNKRGSVFAYYEASTFASLENIPETSFLESLKKIKELDPQLRKLTSEQRTSVLREEKSISFNRKHAVEMESFAKFQEENSTLRKELSKAAEEISGFKESLSKTQEENSIFRKKSIEKIEALEKKNLEDAKERSILKESLSEVQEENSIFRKKSIEKIEALEKKNLEDAKERSILKERLSEIQEEHLALKDHVNDAVGVLNGNISERAEEISSLREELSQFNQKVKEAVESSRRQSTQDERAVSILQGQVEANRQYLEEKFLSIEGRLEAMKSKLEALEGSSVVLREDSKWSDKQFREHKSEIRRELRTVVDEAQTVMASQHERQIQDLQGRVQSQEREMARLKKTQQAGWGAWFS